MHATYYGANGWLLELGNLRVLVMGREQSGQNTDVIFTAQVKNGVTLLTQVPRILGIFEAILADGPLAPAP